MEHRWTAAANLLCVRLDSLGDVLMTTPAMRALKHGRRDRRVTLLTSPSGAAAAMLSPEVDNVMVFDAPWMKGATSTEGVDCAASTCGLIDELRSRRFDAAVIFTVYSQSPLPAAMACLMAQIPLRAAHCRENPYRLLTDWIPEQEPASFIRHEVQRQVDLVHQLGSASTDNAIQIRASHQDSARAREVLRDAGLDFGSGWIMIHPGASAASRRYPPELFTAVTTSLATDYGFQIVFTGDSAECELVEQIRDHVSAPTISVAGQLSIREFAAAIRMVPVLISNNSAPVHIAAGVGTPVVDIYALTNPQHTPWRVPHRVLSYDVPCRNCYRSTCPEIHHDCLKRISPSAVVEATLDLLHECGRDNRSRQSGSAILSTDF